ncbi:SGNH/GDSL hydrolase family protein [Nocardia elegans]|uniref:SGNH/GDSL hydrolase family protein n=1 Tax=Nocardia elegans TaxID=300029 RepID=A0ABW6TLL6_9NOCA
MTALHAASAFDSGPLITRTLSYTNGGLGGSVATSPWASGTTGSWRFVVKLPETTTQWRIKLRNYDTGSAATKTALTGKKIIHGDHSRVLAAGSNGSTGSFIGSTATTIVGADFTIPGDGSWYTSPWVTASADQFSAGVEHLVGINVTAASSLAVQAGCGRAWWWSNATSGADPTIAGSAATNQTTYIPVDWVIEYQVTSWRKAYLFVGDSICEGIMGSRNATPSPTPLWRNYPNLWAASNNALVTNISLAGITANAFSFTTIPAWSRVDHSGAAYDAAVIALGSNDLSTGLRTLAQLQADILTTITNVRAVVGSTKPIYVATIIARTMASNGTTPNQTTWESYRNDYNSWLVEGGAGVDGVIDMDAATRGTSTSTLWPTYVTTDNIHPAYLGNQQMATALAMTIPH